jgi:hypothetical protein
MPSFNTLSRQTHRIGIFGPQYLRMSNTKAQSKHPNKPSESIIYRFVRISSNETARQTAVIIVVHMSQQSSLQTLNKLLKSLLFSAMKHTIRFTWGWGQDQTGQSAYLIKFEPFILVWMPIRFSTIKFRNWICCFLQYNVYSLASSLLTSTNKSYCEP